ncbi:MAG: diguanylate cyclase/phosphodiesterase [Lacrimispora sp.]|jgi:EAL domain-containing protein (putative c-di-GMP-specific phosphodiesterase class I)/GGDEF domain-containing protein|nr:diguanylate cyclase/phosphodiesterase [Lacrimispora sp.]
MHWFQKKENINPDDNEIQKTEHNHDSTVKLERDACLQHLSHALSSNERGVVLKLYIENFKQLNQLLGYEYCENLLNQILAYLKEACGNNVYHYIGVEYMIFLDHFTQGQAMTLAEEVAGRFDRAWKIDDTDCICSVQMGLCAYPGHADTSEQMLKCLDLAVTRAGEGGPNQAVMFDSILQNQLRRRQAIALYLKTALEKDEVEILYRPSFSSITGTFLRAELSMRIFIKGLGLIGAGEFMTVAEDSGQIRALLYYALEKVCQCIRQAEDDGCEFESIALPVSPVLFLQEDFIDEVARIMNVYQVPQGKLALELKESALTMGYLNFNIMLQKLSDMGVELILNDFGSGYSSISASLDLPVHTVKLERLFIWQLETNEKSRHIIEGLIRMAGDLHLSIIAEGVETENQVSVLTEAGCNYQQGFYYSPPLKQANLMKILGKDRDESASYLSEE